MFLDEQILPLISKSAYLLIGKLTDALGVGSGLSIDPLTHHQISDHLVVIICLPYHKVEFLCIHISFLNFLSLINFNWHILSSDFLNDVQVMMKIETNFTENDFSEHRQIKSSQVSFVVSDQDSESSSLYLIKIFLFVSVFSKIEFPFQKNELIIFKMETFNQGQGEVEDEEVMQVMYRLDFQYPDSPAQTHKLLMTLTLGQKLEVTIDGEAQMVVILKKPAEKKPPQMQFPV